MNETRKKNVASGWTWTPAGRDERIYVIGTSGSGKTTTARGLAAILDLPHIELDAFQWGPDWTPSPREVLRDRVADAVAGDRWVVDGNYSVVQDLLWTRATTVVWLDFPLRSVMWQLWWRTVRRFVRREVLWNGNQERLRMIIFSRTSILLWALQSHRRNRERYTALTRLPEYQHLSVVRLRSPAEARRWLQWVDATAESMPRTAAESEPSASV